MFGGIEGISFPSPPEGFLGISFCDTKSCYLMTLVICLISGVLSYLFDISRTGRTVRAMSDDENLSSALGVSTRALKTPVVCIGWFFAGCAGALFVGYNGVVAPTDYTSQFMLKVIAAVMIGGNRTFFNLVTGFLPPTSGHVFWQTRTSPACHHMQCLGVASRGRSSTPAMTPA